MAPCKILIVYDESTNLALLNDVLRDDYILAFARNGKEALVGVEKHHPALILLDIQMPEMDGYEVCKQLKADSETAHIPIIFISAMSQDLDQTKGFEMGAVDYITKPISPPVVRARVRAHLSLVKVDRLEESQRAAVYMLGSAGHYNDTDTGVHIWRMAEYSYILAGAAKCDCTPERIELMKLAAPMHDMGKIGIADSILKKPGRLTTDEITVMQTHSQIGCDILSQDNSPLFQMAAEIALHHHEKWDGSGYPYGLLGIDIPLSARVVALADVFDALSMRRPYKEPWPMDKIIHEIKSGSGKHFDPMLVEAFFDSLDEILDSKQKWDEKEKGDE